MGVDVGAVLFIGLGVAALLAIIILAVAAVVQILRVPFAEPLLRWLWLAVVIAGPAIGPGFWFLMRSNNSRWAR